ncbi:MULTISPECIES: 50S ribosomal protein L3 [unclassified Hahella]|uniref:50S ribosomal protein L3 n=1 Tax=unclassified Hahella TaxID=2624107 RepID=UPI000FDF4B98|nr:MULTISPECIES: 50S ribosomal protein L3 [unclassified Hahella]AZZ94617.1 50S ribosomal protein L3 [Hahella sp. KA22]MBU6952918.1 50S ribosomal protein L3 [Hahella sp. HN01]MDG9672284.1 50S ribosomal protein L3 [Hahella sp. CR1]QAY57990.1 50S ribosomal protein L3 [Hahella sp. KA22]
MAIGLVGRKAGMTRLFEDDGAAVPVTVIQVEKNVIAQVKSLEVDGYRAIQVASGSVKASRVNKPMAGHFAKAGVEAGRVVCEFTLDATDSAEYKVGDEVPVTIFEAGQKVDVSGRSKGKGFAGVIKRWNFSTQDATHGNSLSHRAPGSIGQNQSPGRVFKGKKMAGQMGNKNVTVQTLKIVRVDEEKGLLLIKGAVPGATGADVVIKPAVKA